MPWREQKLNAMTWIGQEGDTTRNRLQNAPNAFLAKVLVNATTRRDVTNTGLAAVSRQVVGDQAVASIGIHAHQCVDVFEVVFLGSRLTQHRRKDLAGRNMKVSKQAQRAVTDVLVFAKHRHSRPSTTIRRDSLECLDSCLFVDADRVDSFAEVEVDRVTIGGTDGADTRVKTWVQFVFAGQPVLVFVRSNLCAPQQLANPATTNSRHDTVGDQLQRKFAMRPLGDWAIALGRIFAGFLKDRRLLFFSHNSLPTSPRQVGKQSNDFLFQNMGLLRAFDLDQSRPMVSPPSPPNTDGIVMQSDRLLDRLVVVAIKCQKDDLAPLSQRNARRLCFGDFLQNGLLFLGHDDLGCLPWHGDTFKENGQNRQFSVNLNSKQDQLVPAALGYWIGQGVFGTSWLMSKIGRLAITHINMGNSTAKKDSAVLMSSPVLRLISSKDNSRETQIKIGQVYQRLSLLAASCGIWCQPMSQIVQVEETAQKLSELQPDSNLFPQLPFRLGFAEPERHHTPRRTLEEIVVEQH